MLERMRIRNFQGHEDFRVVFDERVTTFVGTSDAGKSSVLRALRWVMINRPTGSAFVRHGTKEVLATLWLDEHCLSRRKGKGKNSIVLDGTELEAFGSKSPEPVRLLCNVDETNFQGQHDPPFWLSLTAGQVSKELNTVVNLDEIDRVLTAILKTERRARIETELCEKRVEKVEQECEDLLWVSAMETEWQGIEKKQKILDNMREELKRDRELFGEVGRLRRLSEVEIPDTSRLDALIAKLERAEGDLETARSMQREICRMETQVGDCGEKIDGLQVQLSAGSGGICPLCGGELE